MLLAVLLPMGVWGQTGVQYGVSLYKQFLTQINGGSPGSAYATLWQSYEALSPVAKTTHAGSADYQQLPHPSHAESSLRDVRFLF